MGPFYNANVANLWLMILALVAGLIVWALVVSIQLYRLHSRYRRAMGVAEGADLEEILLRNLERWENVSADVRDLARRMDAGEAVLRRSLHRVGLVRFSAFADTGGDQSFSVALLDANDDGVVLSSLHAREGTRVYAKPVTGGTSSYSLPDEEIQAIEAARRQ